MNIGLAHQAKIVYLFETVSPSAAFTEDSLAPSAPGRIDIDFEKREITLVDPGFDVTDDEQFEAWARERSQGVSDDYFTAWRNPERNLAGVTIFREAP